MNKEESYSIQSEFERQLTKNPAAKAMYEAMDEAGRRKLRRQAEAARSIGEMRRIIDGFTGWQKGHPPYQL